MKVGSVVGLVMAGFVVFVCAANLILAVADSAHPSEWVLWTAGVLIGLVGALVFWRNVRDT